MHETCSCSGESNSSLSSHARLLYLCAMFEHNIGYIYIHSRVSAEAEFFFLYLKKIFEQYMKINRFIADCFFVSVTISFPIFVRK